MLYIKTFLALQIICLSCFVDSKSIGTHPKSKTNCTNLPFYLPSFKCISGQCIDGNKECDGKADCHDGSDETEKCHRIKCLPSWFVCDYGACIDKKFKCDGKRDCADGSDEKPALCKKNENCKLPQHPKNGNFSILSDNKTSRDFVSSGTIVKIDCDEGYKLEGVSALVCENGQWSSEMGRCLKSPDTVTTEATKVSCICKNKESENCTMACDGKIDSSDEKQDLFNKDENCKLPQHPKNGNFSLFSNNKTSEDFVSPGTIMQIDCDEGYKLEGVSALFCDNGQWSSEVGRCLKTCPPRVSTEVMKVTCIYKNKEFENCTNALDGTLAKFKCSPEYEDPELVKRPVHVCKNGTWDLTEPNCVKVKLDD